MQYSASQIVIGKWNLPMNDLRSTSFKIPFYTVEGDGYLVVGTIIAKKSKLFKNKNLLIIPPYTEGLSQKELSLSTYHS